METSPARSAAAPAHPACTAPEFRDPARSGHPGHADQELAQPTGQALSLPEQISALKHRINVAQAITCGHGSLQVGDDRPWESVNAALARAADHAHRTGSISA